MPLCDFASSGAAWGDVPTWIGSIGTLLTLLAAIYAGRQAARVLEIERDRDKVAADERSSALQDARKSQASKVSAWVETPSGIGHVARLAVRNTSELPVYSFEASIERGATSSSIFSRPIVPPGAEPVLYALTLPDLDGSDVAISFVDSLGARWRRHPSGLLESVDTSQ